MWVSGEVTSDLFSFFSLQQIIDLDEKNQILTSNVWLDLTWKDAYMMWNISDYNNITVREHNQYQSKLHIHSRTLGSHPVISGDPTFSSTTAPMKTLNLPTPAIWLSNITETWIGFPQVGTIISQSVISYKLVCRIVQINLQSGHHLVSL